MPSCLIQDSIRADGTGNATILDVIYKAPRIGGPREETEASLELEALVEERATLAAKWDRLDSRTRVLTSYSKTLNGESTEPETLEKFLDMLETNEEAIYLGRAALNRQVKVVDKKLKALRDSMTASEAEGSVKRRTRVTVVVIADVDGPGELNLSYGTYPFTSFDLSRVFPTRASRTVISGALWTPFYDLRARLSHTKKEDSTITVHYRASIRQATGEDWKDVALTLSTASPFVGTSLPTLDPVRIVPQSTALGGFSAFGTKSANTNVGTGFGGFGGTAPQQPQPFVQAPMAQQQQQQPRPASLFGTVASPSTAPTVFSFPASAASAPSFGHSAAVANGEGLGNATLSIRGLSTIPSSSWEKSQTHKVTITEVDLVAELEWSVVPKKSRDAFLLVSSPYAILPNGR